MAEPHSLKKLADWPLWRLLVELHDAERYYGPTSETARILARLVRERLANEGGAPPVQAVAPCR